MSKAKWEGSGPLLLVGPVYSEQFAFIGRVWQSQDGEWYGWGLEPGGKARLTSARKTAAEACADVEGLAKVEVEKWNVK